MSDQPGVTERLQQIVGISSREKMSITERNVARTGMALILSAILGFLLVLGYGGRDWNGTVAITAVIAAAAALGAGFLLGFLFGIPRSRPTAAPVAGAADMVAKAALVAGQAGKTDGADSGPIASAAGRLSVNANLEEISDWLTKIIVGIGLKELNNIPDNLDRLSRYVASGLVKPGAPPPVSFAFAIVVYFSVLGFLSGYLLTRLFLAGAFSAADAALDQLRQVIAQKDQAIEEQKELVTQVIEGATQSAQAKESVISPVQTTPGAPAAQVLAEASDVTVTADERLVALEAKYKSIRETQRSSDARTGQMTAVLNDMVALAPRLTNFDAVATLRSPDREKRLAAYAAIYAQPKPEYLEPLVDSIIAFRASIPTSLDNRPFGEYWAIQALDKVAGAMNHALPATVVPQLVTWASRLPKGTDRWFEMVRIFKRCGIKAAL